MTERKAEGGAAVQPRGRRAWLGWVARLALSVCLLAYLLTRASTRTALTELDAGVLRVLWAAVPFYLVCQLLNTYKWSVILRAMGHRVPFWVLVKATFVGMFSNLFLPTGLGGDVIRAGLLRRYGVSVSTGALAVFMQRFTGLLALLLIAVVGVAWTGAAALRDTVGQLEIVAVVLLAMVAAMAAAAWAERRWALGERAPRWLGKHLTRIGDGLRRLGRAPALMAWVLLLSLAYQLLMVALNLLLARPLDIQLSLANWLWVVPVTTFGDMLPSMGGIGAREFVAKQALKPFQLGGTAVVWSLLWQAQKILTSLPGGVLLLVGDRAATANDGAAPPAA